MSLDIHPEAPAVSPDALARDLAPDGLTAAAPEREPVQDLVRAGFDLAYDTPGDGMRGEGVQGLASHEARNFGVVRTTQLLDEERFGAPADPAANEALVSVLRTPMGADALLPSGLTGSAPQAIAAGRPVGDDVVVLLDREGAAHFGHSAVLIGNDVEGWTLQSKDGSTGWNPMAGPSSRTNELGTGQTTGGMSRPYATLDDFFNDSAIADRYEAAVRVEFNGGPDMGPAARAAATAILREPYAVGASSCAHTVEAALETVQQNPAYGITGFDLNTSSALGVTFRPPIRPEVQFSEVGRQEGADDVVSDAQRAWEVRSAHDGR